MILIRNIVTSHAEAALQTLLQESLQTQEQDHRRLLPTGQQREPGQEHAGAQTSTLQQHQVPRQVQVRVPRSPPALHRRHQARPPDRPQGPHQPHRTHHPRLLLQADRARLPSQEHERAGVQAFNRGREDRGVRLVPRGSQGSHLSLQEVQGSTAALLRDGGGRGKEEADNRCDRRQFWGDSEDVVYVGSKRMMLVSAQPRQLTSREEAQRLKLGQSPFLFVLDQSLTSFANLHRLVALVLELAADGVTSLDAIANIVGRKLVELSRASGRERKEPVFLLLILADKKISRTPTAATK